MLVWMCSGSGRHGLYTNYYRHRAHCDWCRSELKEEDTNKFSIQQQFRTLDDTQRPWSEWSLNNQSCIQHTGHDIEQIQQLFLICSQSLMNYCARRRHQCTTDTNVPYLSPMNLLVVTLWFLKRYPSEGYIATKLQMNKSTVNYFLFEIIDILYSCIYPVFVPAQVSIATRSTSHETQNYNKLLVHSTVIAISPPNELKQRKAYYHKKSPTNYGFKIQIASDFHHRIVHVSQCYHGGVNGLTILRESGLLTDIEKDVRIIGNKSYIGEKYITASRKKSRGGVLTTPDKRYSQTISSARAAVENINQRIKAYAILGRIYRGSIDDFEKITKIVRVVCALSNFDVMKSSIRQNTT
ncbi:unnamed protein product [Rotaria sp. Silwood1]|nr:unnamed protein product [Rotaria sp. Silwood1]